MFVYRPQRRILRYSIASFTCNLSTVAGAAFVTQPSADLTRYIGCKLTLNDGTQNLVGWIKAAGTAETLSDTYVTGWTNTSFETFTTSGADITSAINSDSSGLAYTEITPLVAGYLVKSSFAITHNGGNSLSGLYRIGSSAALAAPNITATPAAGANSIYRTCLAAYTHVGWFRTVTIDFSVASYSLKQVLTPSATGVRIVSTQGGTIYNWASDGGINPNAASFTATITSI